MPTAACRIRRAVADELDWINSRYAEVEFVPSTANELIAVAEIADVRAGIGRVVPIDDNCGELGGMLVFPEYQGLGLARKIITFLQQNAPQRKLYCLPFAPLVCLYEGMGFEPVDDLQSVPSKVIDKHCWCNRFYSDPVLLMEWGRRAGNA